LSNQKPVKTEVRLACTTTTIRRLQREVDVLLGIQSYDVRWDIYDLLANSARNSNNDLQTKYSTILTD
jgi:hypothetical protein